MNEIFTNDHQIVSLKKFSVLVLFIKSNKPLPTGHACATYLNLKTLITIMPKKSIETPLSEITLRRYEPPDNLNDRDLVKRLCLSLGLLQPGDSRDVVIDVLYVLLKSKKSQKLLSSEDVQKEVVKYRKEKKLALNGIAPSNIRRQLKRLRNLFIVEKVKNAYRITEFGRLTNVMDEKIIQYYLPSITNRVKDYFKAVDDRF